MRILALDAATEACSAALLVSRDASLAAAEVIGRYEELGKSHAQRILGMAESLLAEAQVPWSALDGIAASVGPGAFTGVRVSVAVAQGLAFGAGLPVVPVTTLEALAWVVMQHGITHALACLDARMGEVYWGCFAADPATGLIASSPSRVGPPDGVVLPLPCPHRGIGRGFSAYPRLAGLPGVIVDPAHARALPNAREFASLGALRFRAGGALDPADLSPLYLRDKVALTEAERGRPQAPKEPL
jgi:tRNA threonylcarbamoyladenosine biosynthesis protein TsaB